jgi:hypothetical protein
MPRSIIRTTTTAIAIAALAAPTALARPADIPPAVATAATAEQNEQDARSGATNGYPAHPVIDRPSAPPTARPDITPKPAPDVTPKRVADGSTAWTTIGIGIAGSLLAVAGVVGLTRHSRRMQRARVTA